MDKPLLSLVLLLLLMHSFGKFCFLHIFLTFFRSPSNFCCFSEILKSICGVGFAWEDHLDCYLTSLTDERVCQMKTAFFCEVSSLALCCHLDAFPSVRPLFSMLKEAVDIDTNWMLLLMGRRQLFSAMMYRLCGKREAWSDRRNFSLEIH